MTDFATLVSGIEAKVEKLLTRDLQQREELRRQREEIDALKKVIGEQQSVIAGHESRLKTLTITKTLESIVGNVEAKRRINELVREIDKCIGLLNT